MNRFVSIVLKYGVSLFCLLYAFQGVPLRELWDILSRFPLPPMLLTTAVSFAAYVVMGVRLTRMNTPPLSFRSAFCATLGGLAVNNVVPAICLSKIAKEKWLKK